MALFKKKHKHSGERSGVVNSAKTLLANIRFMDVDNPIRTICITSSVPNEGKTFVAANLASAIATSGKTCLVVECDMRRRSMSRALGVHAQYGLYSVMSGERTVQEAAVATQTPNLYFLDAEPRIPNPSDLLNSNRFSNLIDLTRNNYDYVVFDTPPVCTFVDAAVLGTKVDAVFLVVRERFTRKNDVTAATNQLKKSGCNLAGAIMNFCERTSNEYYYYYGYYYSHYDSDSSQTSMPKEQKAPEQKPTRASSAEKAKAPTSAPAAPPSRPVREAQTSVRESTDESDNFDELEDTNSFQQSEKSADRTPGQRFVKVSTPRGSHFSDDEF